MRICPNCGKKVEEDWLVCPFCSTKLKSERLSEEQKQYKSEATSNIQSSGTDYFADTFEDASFNIMDNIEFEKGIKIGDWLFINKIGSGKNSLVWLVEDTVINERKALKIIPIIEGGESSSTLIDYRIKQKFENQKNIIKAERPNEITYLGQEFYFYPLEYIETGNLNDRIKKLVQIDENRKLEDSIIASFQKICQAIFSIHNKGIYNLNLKPENIFFKNEVVKFSDLGWNIGNNKLGKDAEVDIKALGMILFKILTNSKLIQIDLQNIKTNIPRQTYLSDSLLPLISKCLGDDENSTFKNVDELSIAVQEAWITIKTNRKKVDKLIESASDLFASNDFNSAIKNLEKADSIEPLNRDIKSLLQQYKKQKIFYQKNQSDINNVMGKMNFVLVKAGSFKMGSIRGQECEIPVHTVVLDSFFICKYPVTFADWNLFIKESGYDFDWDNNSWGNMPVKKYCLSDDFPMINISWFEAVEYCNWRSKKENLIPCYTFTFGKIILDITKNGYRLPTEAEWEFAARGAVKTNNTKYAGSNKFKDVACTKEYFDSLQPIGRLAANELGIFDMSGNICEWCNDWFSDTYYSDCNSENPLGPKSGRKKVLRGGSWRFASNVATVFSRYKAIPDTRREYIGFRLCRSNT